MRTLIAAAFIAVVPAPLLAQAAKPVAAPPAWTVDPRASRIVFRSSYAGAAVTGSFTRWTAGIAFDPARPETGRVTVDVDLASAVTGDRSVDPQLPSADWFNVPQSPRARFQSSSIAAAAPGRYVARGTLSIRGASAPVTLPFTLAVNGAKAVMAGTVQLDRRAFKLGMGSDAGGQWVPFAVPVEVRLTATRR